MSNSPESKEPKYWHLFVLLALVAAVWAASGFLLYHFAKDPGQFGDMFGAVNALFSGLAFAAIIYTVNLQRTELKLQRDELKLTRAELQGQKEQLAAQNELMSSDAFENNFFQVLRIFSDLVKSIDIQFPNRPGIVGRDCFNNFYRHLSACYEKEKRKNPREDESVLISNAYAEFYSMYHGDVGHYFRTLYNLVKLVDRSNAKEKRFYTNVIRAQLSSQELLLLFYNCQTHLGNEKFYPLIERYALYKTLPLDKLLNPSHSDLCSPLSRGEG